MVCRQTPGPFPNYGELGWLGSRSFPFCQALAFITIEIPDPFRRSDSNRAIPIATVQSFQLGCDFLSKLVLVRSGETIYKNIDIYPEPLKDAREGET